MTLEEFKDTSWGANILCIYDGLFYPVSALDFKEHLVGLGDPDENANDSVINWVRCENIEIQNKS